MTTFVFGSFILIVTGLMSVLYVLINIASVIILLHEHSWFADAICIWLSFNTIIGSLLIGSMWIWWGVVFAMYGITIGFSRIVENQLFIVYFFWCFDLGFNIWGSVELAIGTTAFETTKKISLAILSIQWICFTLCLLIISLEYRRRKAIL